MCSAHSRACSIQSGTGLSSSTLRSCARSSTGSSLAFTVSIDIYFSLLSSSVDGLADCRASAQSYPQVALVSAWDPFYHLPSLPSLMSPSRASIGILKCPPCPMKPIDETLALRSPSLLVHLHPGRKDCLPLLMCYNSNCHCSHPFLFLP